jgi:threonine dehydrogenase-like Zn-dependent dehydrogenase
MCMQCMAGAMAAGSAATGMRAWLAARGRRSRALTVVILGAGLIGAAVIGV